MGNRVDLMRSLPKAVVRPPRHRARCGDPEDVMVSRMFGREYFDGDRRFGYGGYRYDGRWIPVAADIVNHFRLQPKERVLDIGCAKGFLVSDLITHQGIDAFGIDISEYAVRHADIHAMGRLHLGSAHRLPFPDRSFDAVVSINTLHNLDPNECIDALMEIERVLTKRGRAFVQVDSFQTEEEKDRFMSWVLTAKTYGPPEYWLEIFHTAGYQGDYDWMIN